MCFAFGSVVLSPPVTYENDKVGREGKIEKNQKIIIHLQSRDKQKPAVCLKVFIGRSFCFFLLYLLLHLVLQDADGDGTIFSVVVRFDYLLYFIFFSFEFAFGLFAMYSNVVRKRAFSFFYHTATVVLWVCNRFQIFIPVASFA